MLLLEHLLVYTNVFTCVTILFVHVCSNCPKFHERQVWCRLWKCQRPQTYDVMTDTKKVLREKANDL